MKNYGGKKDTNKIIVASIYLILSFILIGIAIYKYVNTKNINNVSLETTLLLVLAILYIFYRLIKDKKIAPVALSGKELPVGKTKSDKKIRIKNYIKESIVFAIIIVALDLMAVLILKDFDNLIIFKNVNKSLNLVYNSLITFGICLIISFGLEFLVGELSIKKYNESK